MGMRNMANLIYIYFIVNRSRVLLWNLYRAIGYSELLSLSKKALTQALEDYPEARKQLEQEGKNRLGKGSSSNTNNIKEELEDQVATSPQISVLISQLKNFDSMMCKEKLAALTAEKEALKQELKTKTEELEEAQRLILEYTDNRTRLKWNIGCCF